MLTTTLVPAPDTAKEMVSSSEKKPNEEEDDTKDSVNIDSETDYSLDDNMDF